jgi:cephalosporin hydroxylase
MIEIDTEKDTVTVREDNRTETFSLGSKEAFSLISRAWLRCGWDNKYVYTFTWMGRPVIQLPEDLLRIQEVICSVKPDVIIETGVAHGGALVFYASLCRLMEKGRVIGVDIEIRPHNRKAIEDHPLFPLITLIEASSIDETTVSRIRPLIGPDDTVMVCLDSSHAKEHVLRELELYAPLVTMGSYIVVMDGIMKEVVGAPRTNPDWTWNNPMEAAKEFTGNNEKFIIEEPHFLFNEGNVTERITYWPCGFIKRIA